MCSIEITSRNNSRIKGKNSNNKLVTPFLGTNFSKKDAPTMFSTKSRVVLLEQTTLIRVAVPIMYITLNKQ